MQPFRIEALRVQDLESQQARRNISWSRNSDSGSLEGMRSAEPRPAEMVESQNMFDCLWQRVATTLLVLVGALLLAAGCGEPGSGEMVNVLLISVDTLRADRLNCYGYAERTVSPNLDAFAADGILFENHVSASPWTTPAHMSLLTGLHPSTHGIIGSFAELMLKSEHRRKFLRLPAARLTLAEALQADGYTNGAFTGGVTLDPKFGFDQGFSHYDATMYKLGDENMTAMVRWLDAHRQTPFFLFWHTFEVHAPYLQTDFLPADLAEFKAAYHKLSSRLREIDSPRSHMSNNEIVKGLLARHGVYNASVCEAMYTGGIRSFDRWFGALVNDLKARGLYDDMLIVFTSDHGDEFADHAPRVYYDAHGHSLYEEIIRAPLIIKLPKQSHAGMRVASISRTVDIMPTILDVTGSSAAAHDIQGESLRPLWETPATAPPRVAFAEGAAREYEVKSIRDGQYKYVVWIGADTVAAHGRTYVPPRPQMRELFDLEADPLERTNVLAGAKAAAVQELVRDLDARLRAHVEAQAGKAEEIELDEETIRRLKALGYIE